MTSKLPKQAILRDNSTCQFREKWTYRDNRHSFAVNWLAKGGDMKRLQEILGHRAVHTTMEVYGRYQEANRLKISSPFES